jgi:hypothetical protein
VEVRWMPGHEQSGRPANWSEDADGLWCLACRREGAAKAALSEAPEDMSVQERARLRAAALVEFEVQRHPGRPNTEIARAVRSSVVAVQKARERLGIPAAPA